MEIKLEAGKTYAGRVLDPDDKPVEGANVSVSDWRHGGRERSGANRWTKTDADGRFTLSGLPNEGSMRLGYGKRDRYLSMSTEWSAAGPAPEVLRIYPKPVVRGRVVDAETGEPVKNFRAVAYWQKDPSPLTFDRAVPGNEDGSFALTIERVILSNPANTPFYAEIQAKGYVSQLTPPVFAGKAYDPPVIKLEKGDPTTGVVADADGTPLAGALVALIKPGNVAYSVEGFKFAPFQDEPQPQAKTDVNGKFELPPVEGEGRLLVLHEKGYLVLPFPGMPGGATLSVIPWAKVQGIARRDGKPLHGVRIELTPGGDNNAPFGGNLEFRLRATTHTNGRFVIEHVPAAPWEVLLGNNGVADISAEPGQTATVELGGPGKAEVGAAGVARPILAAVAPEPVPAPVLAPVPPAAQAEDEPHPEAHTVLLRSVRARTLHWKQTDVNGYGRPGEGKVQTLTHEIWRDVERNFERDRYTDDVKRDDGRPTNDGEAFQDDQFSTVI